MKQLILNGATLNYDDPIILEPLYKISSLGEYLNALLKNKIWDIQPVRDISYFIDFKLYEIIPWWSYHLSNFVYWTLAFFFFYRASYKLLTRFFSENENLTGWLLLASAVFYFHPVFQLEPFWISSRKHLLSTLFIFCSFYYFLKYEEKTESSYKFLILICFFYLLSVFSQPITMLYPFFVTVYNVITKGTKWIKVKKDITLVLILFLIFALAFSTNYVFYYIVYPKLTQGQTIRFTAENMAQLRLLTLGRFFYQIFDVSMASPVEHDRGSVRNIIGLLSFPLFTYFAFKLLDKKIFLILLAWFFYPLTIVILGDVKLFALDTYLVTASMGIILICVSLLQRFKFRLFYFIIIVPLIFLTHDYSKAFYKTYDLAVYAQKKEITSFGQYILTNELLSMGKYNQAFEEAYAFSKIFPASNDLKFLLPVALMGTNRITPIRKKEILNGWKKNSFLAEFYYSMFLNQNSKEFREVQDRAIHRITETFYLKELNVFSLHALAYYVYYCHRSQLNYCQSSFEKLKNLMPPGFWNEKTYQNFYNVFVSQEGLQSSPKATTPSNTENIDILKSIIKQK